jgi:myo-inositol-1-phosphate synthase
MGLHGGREIEPAGRVGLWLAGAGGNVAASVAVGLAAVRRRLVAPIGLATEQPAFVEAGLVSFEDVILGGHELTARRPSETARRLAVEDRLFDRALVEAVDGDLLAMDAEVRRGAAGLHAGDRDGAARVAALQEDLRAFRRRHELERLVVVNVTSTEPQPQQPLPASLAGLRQAIEGGAEIPASVLYAYSALDLGAAYVNFTPSLGSAIPALDELAQARRTVHAGRDGKTGETLVKSVLAPLFAIRSLRVLSWFGQNILGNGDGRSLTEPARLASKARSKGGVVPAILGYAPESHVGIDYVEPLGDWKVAWDHVLFEGFLGARMTLQVLWHGADSLLAAPLVLDLARLVDHALRRGDVGVLSHLAVFFKDPMGCSEQRLDRQFDCLLAHVCGPH